jgi:hypothetical protein
MLKMRYISAFILLLALIGPIVLTYSLLQIHRYEVKERIARDLYLTNHPNQVVRLTLSRYDVTHKVKWEHAREFEYKKQMYDILELSESKDSITYVCIHDEADTRIKNELSQLVNSALDKDATHKSHKQKISIQMSVLFFQEAFVWTTVPHNTLMTKRCNYQTDSYQTTLSVAHPPPQNI